MNTVRQGAAWTYRILITLFAVAVVVEFFLAGRRHGVGHATAHPAGRVLAPSFAYGSCASCSNPPPARSTAGERQSSRPDRDVRRVHRYGHSLRRTDAGQIEDVKYPSRRAGLASPAGPANIPTRLGSGHQGQNAAEGSPAG
jgi:hypothetical protein